MDKYKFRATVYLIFLLVSLFVNGLLLYMLITNENNTNVEEPKIEEKVKEEEKDSVSLELIQDVYNNTYDYINAGVFVDTGFKKNYKKCLLVNFNGMEDYFTNKAIESMKTSLVFDDNNYYDCANVLSSSLFKSILGEKTRDLEMVLSDENHVLVKSKFQYGCDEIDDFPHYMILIKMNDKWLVDSYE